MLGTPLIGFEPLPVYEAKFTEKKQLRRLRSCTVVDTRSEAVMSSWSRGKKNNSEVVDPSRTCVRSRSRLPLRRPPQRWKAFRLFLSMHYSKPLGGALSDIYLEEEREGVQFK